MVPQLPGQLNYWRNAWRPVAVDMSTYVNTLASVIVCCRIIFWKVLGRKILF